MSAERRLCVFFEAGDTRFAVEAGRVLEVAEAEEGRESLRAEYPIRVLSQLLGGEETTGGATVLVVDGNPAIALRVSKVEGVFDAVGGRVSLPPRLIPLLTPAVRGTVCYGGHLYFELDPDGVIRGLPRQTRRVELATRATVDQCLCFSSGGSEYALPIDRVKRVLSRGPMFNRAPGRGMLLGVGLHEGRLFPLFSLVPLAEPEALMVLVEHDRGWLGLSASQAEGVKGGALLGARPVLDVGRMFS